MRPMPSCADAMRSLVRTGKARRPRRAAAPAARARRRRPRRVLLHRAADRARAPRPASRRAARRACHRRLRQPRRPRRLREDLARIDAEVFVVELKAAAVDVVAEEARRRGVRVVLAANDVIPIPGEPALDAELERLAAEAVAHAPEVVGERAPVPRPAAARRRRRGRPGRRASWHERSRRRGSP